MSEKESSQDADDQESPLVVYVDSPDMTDSQNMDNVGQVVPGHMTVSHVTQTDHDVEPTSNPASPSDATRSVIQIPDDVSHVSRLTDVTKSVVYSIVSKTSDPVTVRPIAPKYSTVSQTAQLVMPSTSVSQSDPNTATTVQSIMIPSTVLSHNLTSSYMAIAPSQSQSTPRRPVVTAMSNRPYVIMEAVDMPSQGATTPLKTLLEAAVKTAPDENFTIQQDSHHNSDSELKGHSATMCLTCKDGVHFKRPMFEKCVRRFRSKLYEIARVPEDQNTPILPTYKLRHWKDSLCQMIGNCDTRKLNDCYKHDMKTARSPLPLWREINKLFQRWERKEILGQVRDTLKQTQFKIINAVPEAQRLQLLTELNQSKISFPVFLEKCREETFRHNQHDSTCIPPLDVEDITCTSVSDGEDDVTCTSAKTQSSSEPKLSPPQLSGQIEDLLRKVKELERKWQNSERRSVESENKSFTLLTNLQDITQKLHRKEEQLTSLRRSTEERQKILEQTLKLKLAQLAAKEKEIEFLTAKSSDRVKICEAELALKCAQLTAKEREFELRELKIELESKEMKKRLHEKDAIISQQEDELRYYSQTQSGHQEPSGSQDRRQSRVGATGSNSYQQNTTRHHTTSSPVQDVSSAKRRMDTEVIHMPMKRIKQESEYL